MNRMKKHVITLLFITAVFGLHAQETKSGYGFTSDSTASGYENQDGLGGPKSIGAQLRVDNQKKESYFRLPIRVTKGWYDWKQQLNEETGIQLGINYTTIFLRSSDVLDESEHKPSTSGGVLDFQLGWNLVGRKSGKNKGTLFLKINSRHSYGDRIAPMFHGIFESGYYGLPAVGYNDYTPRILEFNWQQSFLENRLQFVLGKIDPANYFNFHGLIVPWTSFLGYGSSVSGTINWPNQGLGIVGSFRLSDQYYIMAGVADVYGDLFADGDFLDFGGNFFEGNLFKAVEFGWVPTMAERYFKKVSVTFWETDSYTNPSDTNIPGNAGVAISTHWFFQNKFAPYFRVGFSNGNGENTFYKRDIQIGHGFVFRSHDLLGLAFSSAKTNIDELTDEDGNAFEPKDQMTLEAYYRFHLTQHLAITPDAQLIINPTLNQAVSSLWYYGVRVRATF